MVDSEGRSGATPDALTRVCRVGVPERWRGDRVIVARPSDGSPVVLDVTAAIVWNAIDDWTTVAALDSQLASIYPSVAANDRHDACREVLVALSNDGLIETR